MSRPETIRVFAPDGRVIHYPADMPTDEIQDHLDSLFSPQSMSAHRNSTAMRMPGARAALRPLPPDPIAPSTVTGGGFGTGLSTGIWGSRDTDFMKGTPNTIMGQLGQISTVLGSPRPLPEESDDEWQARRFRTMAENMAVGMTMHTPETNTQPFFSQLIKTIEEKMPNTALSGQVLNIARKGSRAEEMAWLGLEDYLTEHAGKVDKGKLLEHLRSHEISVHEIFKGEARPADVRIASTAPLRQELSDALHDVGYLGYDSASEAIREMRRNPNWATDYDVQAGRPADDRLLDIGNRYLHAARTSDAPGGPAKFKNYQLDGPKENYRNLLLTLPQRADNTARLLELRGQFEAATARVRDAARRAERGPRDPVAVAQATSEWQIASQEAGRIDDEMEMLRAQSRKTDFKGNHYEEPNILAHIRFNDRVDANGKRTLFIEEIQSDWHQKGRKSGYREADEKRLNELDAKLKDEYARTGGGLRDPAERAEYIRLQDRISKTVPDAPFKESWRQLSMKRMMRYAAENGYDQIAWTTGAQQIDRYNEALRQNVDKISWYPTKKNGVRVGTVDILADKNGKGVFDATVPLHGTTEINGKDVDLDDVVGKHLAEKIRNGMNEEHADFDPLGNSFEGKDLSIGGAGLKEGYDKIIPNFVNEYGKKWGVKVGKTDLHTGYEDLKYQGPNLTWEEFRTREDQLRETRALTSVLRAQLSTINDAMFHGATFESAMNEEGSHVLAEEFGGQMVGAEKHSTVHKVDITPEMKESVLTQGQPLFSAVPMLPRINHGTFGAAGTMKKDSDNKKFKRIAPSAPPPSRPPQ